jgi:hypothetical protein
VSERRALLVGINTYAMAGANLKAPVADVGEMFTRLERNYDREPNYHCRVLADKMETGGPITRASLRRAIKDLFANLKGDALFYYSGHGALTGVDGWLVTSDAEPDDLGVPLAELFNEATAATTVQNVVVILDCCHAGSGGNVPFGNPGGAPVAAIREDLTVIAASRDVQPAYEAGGHSLFTTAVIDALDGGAADHMGWVTAASIYAYVERRFTSWSGQRPVYKSHATHSHVVRECAPLIERQKLHELVKLFPALDHKYALDPEHDPEDENGNIKGTPNPEKLRVSMLMKEYRDAGLVKASVAGEQFYWTARRSHTLELTGRGREYWALVTRNVI